MSSPGLWDTLCDRALLPGMAGFTNLGYRLRSRTWKPVDADLGDRTVVVTGATSGVGRVTAEALAALEARVVLVARSADKAGRTRDAIMAATGNRLVTTQLADLSLMSEVRALAGRLLEAEPEIHVLINVAGTLFKERRESAEGIELTLATNLLSQFLLTNLLIPRLVESAPARIVNVSSGGMYTQAISLRNLQWEHGSYDGPKAYARSKRGQVVLTEMWAERLEGTGVVVNAMHPGWADTPGVRHSLPGFYRLTRPFLRTPEQGADTIVWLAASPEAAEESGLFWLDRRPHVTEVLPGTATSARDRAALWDQLSELSGWEG